MKHRWLLKARDPHTERFECVKCDCIKTVVSMTDQFPRVRYHVGDLLWEKAPECVTLRNAKTTKPQLRGLDGRGDLTYVDVARINGNHSRAIRPTNQIRRSELACTGGEIMWPCMARPEPESAISGVER